jgi:serine phosphatase RsbU (regulator of sigma subunit)
MLRKIWNLINPVSTSKGVSSVGFGSVFTFLELQLNLKQSRQTVVGKVRAFLSLSSQKQIEKFPETYLYVEAYLCEVDKGGRMDRDLLRSELPKMFPFLLQHESISLIFEPPEKQGVLLCKYFLIDFLKRAATILGTSDHNIFTETTNWLSNTPNSANSPVPFNLCETPPQTHDKWHELLVQLTQSLFDFVNERYGYQFTQNIFDASYKNIAQKYQSLDSFIKVVALIPQTLLDAAKISLISNAQLQRLLKEKVRELEEAKKELETQNVAIKEQRDAIRYAYDQITKSITYARRIQQETLHDINLISKYFEDSFVFFKPKQIVSGDFIWIHERANKVLLAVIDCTGHGVPGAFMTLMTHDKLNEIVINSGFTSPELILDELDKSVKRSAIVGEYNQLSIGMDMMLCSIGLNDGIVEFAGAKNWLYHVSDQVLNRYRGDRRSIGGKVVHSYNQEKFTLNKLQIKKGDCIYLSTDGYQDQFGVQKGELTKYGSAYFRGLLLRISPNPMKEQLELLSNELELWQGSVSQTDDITVAGFRFLV